MLVEALAALVIAAAIIAIIASVAGQTLRNWNRGQGTIGGIEMATRGLARLSLDLAATIPMRVPGSDSGELLFRGDARTVMFVAATGFAAGNRGEELIGFRTITENSKVTLVRERGPISGLGNVMGDPVVLLSGPLQFRFFYRDRDGRRLDSWIHRRDLPIAIELEVRTTAGTPVLPAAAVLTVPVNYGVDCLIAETDDEDMAERCKSGTAVANAELAPAPKTKQH